MTTRSQTGPALALAAALTLAAGATVGRADEPVPVTIAQTSVALGFSPVAIAEDEGFFKKEGIAADIQLVSAGDSQVIAALHSGGAEFGAVTLVPVVQAVARGEKLRLVSPFVREFVIQFVINPDSARKAGLSAAMPLPEKFRRIKGMTVGTLDVGGGLHLMFKALAKRYGLDSDRDFTVTAINSFPTLLAAAKRGQIDVALTAIPYGELGVEEDGLVMLADFWHGAIPEYDGAHHQGLVVTSEYERSHPDVVRRMNLAMDDALAFIQEQPDRTVADLHKRYPRLPEALIRDFLVRDAASFAKRAIVSRHGFDIIRDFVAQNLVPQAAAVDYAEFVLPYAQEK